MEQEMTRRDWKIVAWVSTFYVLWCIVLVLYDTNAFGQGHNHPSEDEAIHEKFYSNWYMPDNPARSCCSNYDCYPTEAQYDGRYWWVVSKWTGARLYIPTSKIELNRDNPDGRNHVCVNPHNDEVLCFIVGGGM